MYSAPYRLFHNPYTSSSRILVNKITTNRTISFIPYYEKIQNSMHSVGLGARTKEEGGALTMRLRIPNLNFQKTLRYAIHFFDLSTRKLFVLSID